MGSIQGILLSCPPKDRENNMFISKHCFLTNRVCKQFTVCASFTFQKPSIFAVLQLENKPIN